MKTGRLLKFQRPLGEVHAYLFREESGAYSCVVYAFAGPRAAPGEGQGEEQPVQRLEGPSEAAVEANVRAWVEAHFPRQP